MKKSTERLTLRKCAQSANLDDEGEPLIEVSADGLEDSQFCRGLVQAEVVSVRHGVACDREQALKHNPSHSPVWSLEPVMSTSEKPTSLAIVWQISPPGTTGTFLGFLYTRIMDNRLAVHFLCVGHFYR